MLHHSILIRASHSQPRGPIIPATVLLEASHYPDAAIATRELQKAKRALEAAKARKKRLDAIRVRMFAGPANSYRREVFEDRILDPAAWHLRQCFEDLQAVEEAAGLFCQTNRERLAGWIESAIGLLDTLDGNPDLEDGNDREASDGDDRDIAWLEWSGLTPSQRSAPYQSWGSKDAAPWLGGPSEDDEDDDPQGACDEDGVNTNLIALSQPGPGCAISDPGGFNYR